MGMREKIFVRNQQSPALGLFLWPLSFWGLQAPKNPQHLYSLLSVSSLYQLISSDSGSHFAVVLFKGESSSEQRLLACLLPSGTLPKFARQPHVDTG